MFRLREGGELEDKAFCWLLTYCYCFFPNNAKERINYDIRQGE